MEFGQKKAHSLPLKNAPPLSTYLLPQTPLQEKLIIFIIETLKVTFASFFLKS